MILESLQEYVDSNHIDLNNKAWILKYVPIILRAEIQKGHQVNGWEEKISLAKFYSSPELDIMIEEIKSSINITTTAKIVLSEDEDSFLSEFEDELDSADYCSSDIKLIIKMYYEQISGFAQKNSPARLGEVLNYLFVKWFNTGLEDKVQKIIYDSVLYMFKKSFEDYTDYSEEKYKKLTVWLKSVAKNAEVDYTEDLDEFLVQGQVSISGPAGLDLDDQKWSIDEVREMLGLCLLYGEGSEE